VHEEKERQIGRFFSLLDMAFQRTGDLENGNFATPGSSDLARRLKTCRSRIHIRQFCYGRFPQRRSEAGSSAASHSNAEQKRDEHRHGDQVAVQQKHRCDGQSERSASYV